MPLHPLVTQTILANLQERGRYDAERVHEVDICVLCGNDAWRCSRPPRDGEAPGLVVEYPRFHHEGDALCRVCEEFRGANGMVFAYLTRVLGFLAFQVHTTRNAPPESEEAP